MEGLSVLMPVGGVVDSDPWRKKARAWVQERYLEALYDFDVEIVEGASDQEPYNRSQARNDAFAKSSHEMLVVADADTVFNPNAMRIAISMVRSKQASWVLPYALERYYNLSADATEHVLQTLPAADIPEPDTPDVYGVYEHKLTSSAGVLVMPRTAWEAVGGYDEAFIGWGYEDDAMRYALDRHVGSHQRVTGGPAYVMHLWHPHTEEERFSQEHIEANRARVRQYEQGLLP